MPRHDDDEEDDDEYEDFDDDWQSDDDEDTTDACPYCRKAIYDDVVHCPHCGQYLSQEDSPPSPKPWWIIAGVAICLYIVFRSIVG